MVQAQCDPCCSPATVASNNHSFKTAVLKLLCGIKGIPETINSEPYIDELLQTLGAVLEQQHANFSSLNCHEDYVVDDFPASIGNDLSYIYGRPIDEIVVSNPNPTLLYLVIFCVDDCDFWNPNVTIPSFSLACPPAAGGVPTTTVFSVSQGFVFACNPGCFYGYLSTTPDLGLAGGTTDTVDVIFRIC